MKTMPTIKVKKARSHSIDLSVLDAEGKEVGVVNVHTHRTLTGKISLGHTVWWSEERHKGAKAQRHKGETDGK